MKNIEKVKQLNATYGSEPDPFAKKLLLGQSVKLEWGSKD